jgi:hypothetical protein
MNAWTSDSGRGITTGPGTFTKPGAVTPEQADRPYISDGHASRSPVGGPPDVSPLPPQGRGILTPLAMPGLPAVSGTGPIAETMARHKARAISTRPPIPGGAA